MPRGCPCFPLDPSHFIIAWYFLVGVFNLSRHREHSIELSIFLSLWFTNNASRRPSPKFDNVTLTIKNYCQNYYSLKWQVLLMLYWPSWLTALTVPMLQSCQQLCSCSLPLSSFASCLLHFNVSLSLHALRTCAEPILTSRLWRGNFPLFLSHILFFLWILTSGFDYLLIWEDWVKMIVFLGMIGIHC